MIPLEKARSSRQKGVRNDKVKIIHYGWADDAATRICFGVKLTFMAAKKKVKKRKSAKSVSKKSAKATPKKSARKKPAAKTAKKKTATKKVTKKKVVTAKRAAPANALAKKVSAGNKAAKKPVRADRRMVDLNAGLEPYTQRARSGGQSGDLQGLSDAEGANSESVDELLEEGNSFEAGAVAGVEEADNEDEREVHTHEVLEDDVPGEYLDKDE